MGASILLMLSLALSTTYAKKAPRISSLHITSDIQSRFATTLMTSTILNPNPQPMEVEFHVTLPKAAFISNFSMEVDQKTIVGEVKEKEKAENQYEQAKSRGQTAGRVAQRPRETSSFGISINVAANDIAKFNLTYQEMLKRVHGAYKHVININPGHVVQNMQIDVYINENRDITTLHVPQIKEKIGEKTNKELLKLQESKQVQVTPDKASLSNKAKISYKPSKKQKMDKAVAGQMVVLYDVERIKDGGEVQVVNGYFVHFFAPSQLPVCNKNVVFVLDTSSSMKGTKIKQLKQAMTLIMDDVNEGDRFNIVRFSRRTSVWKHKPVVATKKSKAVAVKYIEKLRARRSTNIHKALKQGIGMLNKSGKKALAKMIVFLTDGRPTAGQTDTRIILKNCKKWNIESTVNIHALAFGDDADYSLVRKLSAQSDGLARKIYEASDAVLQLEGFYDEISSPLMSDIKIKYLNETVDAKSIVQDNNNIYYDGGEVVAIGKLNGKKLDSLIDGRKELALDGSVSGNGKRGAVHFDVHRSIFCHDICPPWILHRVPRQREKRQSRPFPCRRIRCHPPPTPKPEKDILSPNTVGGFVERMWAYLTIKKILHKANFDETNSRKQVELKKKALKLSLDYNFVTELTSMVVTKPNKIKPVPLEERAEKPTRGGGDRASSRGGAFASGGGGSRFGLSGNRRGGSGGRGPGASSRGGAFASGGGGSRFGLSGNRRGGSGGGGSGASSRGGPFASGGGGSRFGLSGNRRGGSGGGGSGASSRRGAFASGGGGSRFGLSGNRRGGSGGVGSGASSRRGAFPSGRGGSRSGGRRGPFPGKMKMKNIRTTTTRRVPRTTETTTESTTNSTPSESAESTTTESTTDSTPSESTESTTTESTTPSKPSESTESTTTESTTPSKPSDIPYMTGPASLFSMDEHIQVIADDRDKCAKLCLETSGCTSALFDPQASDKKCKLGLQTDLPCSKTSEDVPDSEAVTMFCIESVTS